MVDSKKELAVSSENKSDKVSSVPAVGKTKEEMIALGKSVCAATGAGGGVGWGVVSTAAVAAYVAGDGKTPVEFLDYTVDLMKELQPQNVLEGMLVARIVASHNLGMSMLSRSGNCPEKTGSYAIKLLRLANETLATLLMCRRKEQPVQHLVVNDGGRAVAIGTAVSLSQPKNETSTP